MTCVHPGLTRTEKTPGVIAWRAGLTNKTEAEVDKWRLDDLNTIRRLVTAEEIGHIVAFLASPKCDCHQRRCDCGRRRSQPGSIYY